MATTLQNMQPPDLLECHPQQGTIQLHSERVVVLSAAAVGLLRKELIAAWGSIWADGF
jgi:hypothetical protein